MRRHLVLVLITLLIPLVFPESSFLLMKIMEQTIASILFLPDNQREGRSFFDLRVEPGTKQTLRSGSIIFLIRSKRILSMSIQLRQTET